MKEQTKNLPTTKLESKLHKFKSIKVLTIHDPYTIKSSCAITVNVGSAYEPQQIPGLAHLLQHMLLLSSAEYTDTNSFSQYIAAHSGYQNAQTFDYFTNYYFDIFDQYFEQAFKRICNAFTQPLFRQQDIQPQIQAVHEQFVIACTDDDNKQDEVIKIFMRQPLNRFVMGNNKTLKIPTIRAMLIKFYEQFYRNGQIYMVIYSRMKIQEMQSKLLKYVNKMSELFNQQENQQKLKNLSNLSLFKAYDSQKLNKLVQMKSIDNQDTLSFQYIINLTQNPITLSQLITTNDKLSYLQNLSQFCYQFKQVFDYIICHASDKCLQNYLQDHDFITQCSVQYLQIVPFTQFKLTIKLVIDQQDINKIPKLYQKVCEYLNLMLNLQNFMIAYKQIKYIYSLNFKNYQIEDLEDKVSALSQSMYLKGVGQNFVQFQMISNNILQKYKNLTAWCIQQILTSKNKLLLLRTQQKLKGNIQKQLNLNSHYIIKDIPPLKNLKLPQASAPTQLIPSNPFIPLPHHNIHPPQNSPFNPIKLSNNIYFTHSFRQITKGGIRLTFYNQQNQAFNRILAQFITFCIAQIADIQFATQLGLQYYLNYHHNRLFLQIYGFDSLVLSFLQKIGKQIKQFITKVTDGSSKYDEDLAEMFEQSKDIVTDQIQDYYQEQMDDLSQKILDQVLLQNSQPLNILKKQVKKIKYDNFLQKVVDLLKNCYMQWIVVGNFDPKQVTSIIKKFQSQINNKTASNPSITKFPQSKILNLSNPTQQTKQNTLKLQIHLISQTQTSTCLSYFQAGLYSQQLNYILDLLAIYLQQPFYNYMRVINNISYDIQINVVNTRGILGICLFVVSSKYDSQSIAKQIKNFINKYLSQNTLKQILQKQYNKLKHLLILKYSEQFSTVQDYFDFIIDQVVNRSYNFSIKNKQQIQTKIQNITVQKIIQTAHRIFFKSTNLQLLLIGKKHRDIYYKNRNKQCIITLEDIKFKCQYYTDLLSNIGFSFVQEINK